VGSRVDRTNELARTNAERTKPEEKFKSLLQSAPDAMVIVKQEGEIVLVNSQTEKLFGYSPEELLSKKVQILLVLNEPPPARRT
jgi:PAS domain S-box-containing protein